MTVLGLEDDVESNTRREFERFLLAILQCQREEGVDAIDEDGAEADAQELYDVSTLKSKKYFLIFDWSLAFILRLVKTDGCLPMNQSSLVLWLVDHGCKSVSSQQNTKISPVVLSCKLSMTNAEVILNVHTRLLFVWHVIHASISLEIFTKL